VEELQALNADKQKKMEESLKSDDNYVPVDKQDVLTKMLEFLKPGETVAKVSHNRIVGYCCEVKIFAKFANAIWICKNFYWFLKILMFLFNIFTIKVVYFRFLLHT